MLERAAHRRQTTGEPTVFFLDEIHRFNKAQQDALLPAVEEGLVTLIGATTENPYFEVNSALLSRAQVYELHALDGGRRRGAAAPRARTGECGDPPSTTRWSVPRRAPGGDARTALAALELACETTPDGEPITLEVAEDALQRRALRYDKAGDQHYDTISAWIKATRGSDPDASLYYLAVMLEGGEDPRFIARRMVILASEDIGNADPQALPSRSPPRRRSSTSGCPRPSTRWPRPRSTSRWRRSPTPPTGRSARPRARPRARRPAAAAPPALGRLRAPRRWARPGLRLPPRPPGPRVGAGAHARGRRRRAVLRARRRRGRAAERLEEIRRAALQGDRRVAVDLERTAVRLSWTRMLLTTTIASTTAPGPPALPLATDRAAVPDLAAGLGLASTTWSHRLVRFDPRRRRVVAPRLGRRRRAARRDRRDDRRRPTPDALVADEDRAPGVEPPRRRAGRAGAPAPA